MAVGKVGSFATVQPAIVDFGGMAQGAFDKIKAEEERKRKEKEALEEKRRQEIEKLGGIGGLKTTNIKGFNQGLYNAYEPLKRKFAEAKASGDTSKMREIQEQVFSFNNIVDAVNKQYQFILNEKDKLDPVYVARFENAVNNIDIANMDVSVDESGRIGFTLYEDTERTKPMFVNMQPNEILDNLSQIPYAFNEVAYVKEFTKTYPLSKIEELIDTKGLVGTSGKSLLKEDKSVQEAINSQAKMLANDSKALAYFGARELNKFDTDSRLWSNEEKKKAEDYYRKSLENAYAEKIDLSIQQKRSGSGDKEKKINLTNVVNGVVTTTGEKGSVDVPVLEVGVMFGAGSRNLGVTLGNENLTNIAYDPASPANNPRLWFRVSTSGSEGQSISGRTQGGEGTGTRFGQASSAKRIISLNSAEGKDLLPKILTSLNDPNVKNAQDLVNKYFGGSQSTQTTASGGNLR